MKLPRDLEYAIALLPGMAGKDKPVKIRDLSKSQNVPANQAGRVLRKMVRAGLVQAIRGREGGYLLDPNMLDLYTLMDLIQATGGGIYTRPEPPNKTCADVRALLAEDVRKRATSTTFRMILEGRSESHEA